VTYVYQLIEGEVRVEKIEWRWVCILWFFYHSGALVLPLPDYLSFQKTLCSHQVSLPSRKEPPKEPAASGLPQSTVLPQSIPSAVGGGGGGGGGW
jgi:hypothetical protein